MKSNKHLRLTLCLLVFSFPSLPAFAVSKDMVQLQTQIQQLQDAVARLQQSNDERMGVMKDLVQQNADSVNKMSATMDAVARSLQTQNEAQGGKLDQVSGQIQALNDSLDEMKTRLARLEKLTQDIQSQQQSIGAPATTAPPAAGSSGGAQPPEASLPATPPTGAAESIPSSTTTTGRRGKPSAGVALDATPTPASAAAPVDDLYKAALGDYMAAKYSLSAGEFADVIRYYPDNALSGNAFYYLGEIDYRGGKYTEAAKDYDMVLDHFPSSNKVPPSRLHKGQALMALKQNDAAVREFRTLIQRFPNSPEASLALSRLSGMGITVAPHKASLQ